MVKKAQALVDPYAGSRTDPALEREGVWIDFGVFKIRIARAGGANKEYKKALTLKVQPYRRMIAAGTLSEEKAQTLKSEVFIETIVKGWMVQQEDDTWVAGVHDPKTCEVLKATPANMQKALTDSSLHDVYAVLVAESEQADIFKQTLQEEQVKNS